MVVCCGADSVCIVCFESSLSQRVKHSKLAEGIEQAIAEDKKFIPAGVDPDSVRCSMST